MCGETFFVQVPDGAGSVYIKFDDRASVIHALKNRAKRGLETGLIYRAVDSLAFYFNQELGQLAIPAINSTPIKWKDIS